MATLCLNLSSAEREALEALAQQHQMSQEGVMRQALRLYQLYHRRLKDGETVTWSGDAQRTREFRGK